MMMILSSSPSSSDDDDRVIITIIISGGGCRGRKHAWKLGVLVISLFLDRTQKPYLLSVVEIVGELKPKGWGNQKAEETKRFRKHDPEISTHCYPDAQTDREAVMQREWERTKSQMTDSLSRTSPDTDTAKPEVMHEQAMWRQRKTGQRLASNILGPQSVRFGLTVTFSAVLLFRKILRAVHILCQPGEGGWVDRQLS